MADASSPPSPTPGQTPSQSAPAATANGDGNRRIRIGLFIVLGILALVGSGYGIRWLVYGRYIEYTDDAYLRQLKLHAFRLGLDISGTAVGNDGELHTRDVSRMLGPVGA